MSTADYLVGAVFFLASAGTAVLTALLVSRRLLPSHAGSARVVAVTTLSLGTLVAAHLLPAMLTVLSRGTVLAAGVALCLVAWRLPARTGPPVGAPEPGAPDGVGSWLIAATALAVVAVYSIAFLVREADQAIVHVDTLTFHVPNIAEWIQTQSVWRVDQYVADTNYGNYPQNGDVWIMAWILPWQNDAFVRFADFPLLCIAGLAVFGLARELRASRADAVLLAAAFLSVPAVLKTGIEKGMADPFLCATFPAGLLFLLRHRRTGAASDLVLAGLGLGLGFGAKWYGVSSVAIVLIVWAAASLIGRVGLTRIVAEGAKLSALVLTAGGVWLLRNLIESGNPVMPVKVAPLGVTIFDAPRDLDTELVGYSISDFFGDFDAITDVIVPRIGSVLGEAGWLLLAGVVVFLVVSLVAPLLRRPGILAMDSRAPAVAVAAGLLMVAYVFTPYTAIGIGGEPVAPEAGVRYLSPVLAAAAGLCAMAVGRLGPLRRPAEFVVLVAVGLTVQSQFDVSRSDALAVAVGLALAGALVIAPVRLVGEPVGRRLAALAALGVLAAIAGAGYQQQRDFNDARYVGLDPAVDYLRERDAGRQHIGLVGRFALGTTPILPVFGEGLDNDVVYLGHFVEGTMRDYRDEESFVAAVQDEAPEFVLVSRINNFTTYRSLVRQEPWLEAIGFERVTQSRRMALYRRLT